MTLITDIINDLIGIKESYQASDALMEILLDKEKRKDLFLGFLKHETQLDRDWFHIYFEEEHANKKKFAQDFTPDAISELVAKIVDRDSSDNGIRLDVASGTGSLVIQKWHADCMKWPPFEYKPSMYFYQCEELSDRAIPFLLFNLLIRGMNATVVHGDVLSREAKQIYFIQNDEDDFLQFSSLNVMPHSESVSEYFDIREWKEAAIIHIESPVTVLDRFFQSVDEDCEAEQMELF